MSHRATLISALDADKDKVVAHYARQERLAAEAAAQERDAARWREFLAHHCKHPESVQMLIDDAIEQRKGSAALVGEYPGSVAFVRS